MRTVRVVAVVSVPLVLAAIAAGCTSKDGAPATPTATREQLLDPATCTQCHADHYREWSGSMHAYASEDPVFRAMNKRGQRETNGALGAFCVNCHAPMAVRDGKTKDGLNLDSLEPKYKGVTCFFCHSVDRVDGSHNAALHLADDLVLRGEYADPVANTVHRAQYSTLIHRDEADSAKLCGACHDITTDHGANIERTFAEWQGSVFGHLGGGATCSQCHMNRDPTPRPIAVADNVFSREYHSHAFPAIDTATTPFPEADAQKQGVDALLKTTLQGTLCVEQPGAGASSLLVVLDSAGAGHGFPSGSAQDRRLWVEIIAYRGGTSFYQTGVVADGASVIDLKDDPDLWLVRDCMFDGQSKEVRMFWDAASFESNSLPALATFEKTDPAFYKAHVFRTFPRNPQQLLHDTPDRVTLRVRVQPIGYDVIDDLVTSGDLDRSVRDKILPRDVFTLEWTPDKITERFNDQVTPVTCVGSTTSFLASADKIPAVSHTKCSPP